MSAELERFVEGVKSFFKGEWINTMNVPNKITDSNQATFAAAANLRVWPGVDIRQRLKGPARFLRLSSSTAAVLFIKKPYDPKYEIQIREPLVAGTYYNFVDEDIMYFRIETAVFPCTVIWYASR